jgi:hypothetical protein
VNLSVMCTSVSPESPEPHTMPMRGVGPVYLVLMKSAIFFTSCAFISMYRIHYILYHVHIKDCIEIKHSTQDKQRIEKYSPHQHKPHKIMNLIRSRDLFLIVSHLKTTFPVNEMIWGSTKPIAILF